jgi:hypothetical protein
MSTIGLYDPTGDLYNQVSCRLAGLDSDLALSAHLVYHALMELRRRGIEPGEEVTDRWLQENSPWLRGWSRSFIQKGLHTLEHVLKMIHRARQHGRRIISFIWRLRQRGTAGGLLPPDPPSGSPSAPPQTPPEGSRQKQQTTTDGPSSSSPEKIPEKPPEPEDPTIAALCDRACKLVPEVTPGQVRSAIGEFSAAWVASALDRVEKVNRTPGRKQVTSWGFVLRILVNRRNEGWELPQPKPAPQQPAPVQAPAEPAPEAPKLLPAELAELVEQSKQRGVPGRLAATQIRMAASEGRIPAELMATIPAEILAGPGVPAAVSG